MGLFDQLGQRPAQGEGQQITPDMMRREMSSIQQNPGAYLSQRGFTVPDGMTDPRQITQHLLRTGQVGGGRLQQVMRMLGMGR